MKKILLIGGNGYLGCRIYEYLLNKKYDVTNLDLGWFGIVYPETIQKDYRDLTKEELSKYTHIILLAGHSSVSMCGGELTSCFNNNVFNFTNLLDKIDDNQTLIYSSTLAVYGNNPKLVTEEDPIKKALNVYDYTKIARENIANFYPNKKLIGLRFGSVSGFSPNFRNENLLNALTLSSINQQPLTISNGDAYRSVLGLNDLCCAIDKIIEVDIIKNKIYNLTSISDKIINFGYEVKRLTDSELIVNDSFKTDYSFNCSAELFEKDYNFKFGDTIESIYNNIITNYDSILFNTKREKITYE
jgi:nucleoside-diphosphate-sugar epimerase